jgi:hypothetical protein
VGALLGLGGAGVGLAGRVGVVGRVRRAGDGVVGRINLALVRVHLALVLRFQHDSAPCAYSTDESGARSLEDYPPIRQNLTGDTTTIRKFVKRGAITRPDPSSRLLDDRHWDHSAVHR